MAIVSILLAVVAVFCTLAGFLATLIPVAGVVLSFGAAAIALGGIMLGGKATSRAKQRGEPYDVARIGVWMNVVAFIPALLVAVTCGLCNALVSTGNVQMNRDVRFGVGPGMGFDQAGSGPIPDGPQEPEPAPGQPGQPQPGDPPRPTQPAPNQPPPTLPPPPLPAGPRP
jgi:hypothetical protein